MKDNDDIFVGYSEFFKDSPFSKPTLDINTQKFIDLSNDRTMGNSNPVNSLVSPNGDNTIPSEFTFTKPSDSNDKVPIQDINGKGSSTKLKQDITNYINSLDLDEGYKKYLLKLAERESSFNPNVINAQGYKGLFQMGDAALKDVGMTTSEYMSDWKRQIDAIIKYTDKHRDRLSTITRTNTGKDIDGIKINEWGLLGAAHLGGIGGVTDLLLKGANAKDVNGTTVKEYLKYFSKS